MKISVNDQEIFSLSEVQKKVIMNDIPSDVFEADMARRCKYWLEVPMEKHAYSNREKFIKESKDKGLSSIPTNALKLACSCIDSEKSYSPMACKCGDQDFEISADHLKVWDHLCKESDKESALQSRMSWILQHKYERCLERMKMEWLPKFEARGIDSVPSDDEEFANLVFSQPDYKSRSQRE